jgi:hypothetical protein
MSQVLLPGVTPLVVIRNTPLKSFPSYPDIDISGVSMGNTYWLCETPTSLSVTPSCGVCQDRLSQACGLADLFLYFIFMDASSKTEYRDA